MALLQGFGKHIIGSNVQTLKKAGHSELDAIHLAFQKAGAAAGLTVPGQKPSHVKKPMFLSPKLNKHGMA